MRTPDITTIETSTLGNRSYLVTMDGHAFVVDPQRDLDRMTELLDGLTLTHVVETHIHNDYVTGGLALARSTGADYVLNAEDAVAFDRVGVTGGQQLDLGPMALRVVATPGHTPSHLSYVLLVDDTEIALFSGGSMLFGTTGRTDLIDPGMTEDLTRRQYASVRALAHDLSPTVKVLPTHGFGSFCAASGGGEDTDESTIGDQRRSNSAVTTPDVETFVRNTIEGLGAYPRYYREMGPINASGPDGADLAMPTALSSAAVDDALASDTWVVDVRPRRTFAAGHRKGTVNVEADGTIATYLGWILPSVGTPLALMASEDAQVEQAVRDLSRIGVDDIVGAWVGADPGDQGYRVATFDDLRGDAVDRANAIVLDVRRDEEVADGAIDGSIHIPLPDLQDRVGEIPAGVVWVHCASGFRASIAASLLDRVGREVVLIDDDFEEEDAKIELA